MQGTLTSVVCKTEFDAKSRGRTKNYVKNLIKLHSINAGTEEGKLNFVKNASSFFPFHYFTAHLHMFKAPLTVFFLHVEIIKVSDIPTYDTTLERS